jgi:hypothetical protein
MKPTFPDSEFESQHIEAATHSDFGELESESAYEILPFSVKIVRTEEQLKRACELRAAAYSHHLPELGKKLLDPEPLDRDICTLVFVAEDKVTGMVVGTVRLQINLHQPLQLEESVKLPPQLTRLRLTEISRLSVSPGYEDNRVKLALVKACYLYCLAMQVRVMVITSRFPIFRWHLMLGFSDIFEDRRMVRCKHIGDIPHRILYLDVYATERNWKQRRHKHYNFIYYTFHPDIEVFSAVSSGWARPRASDRRAELQPQWSALLPRVGDGLPARIN